MLSTEGFGDLFSIHAGTALVSLGQRTACTRLVSLGFAFMRWCCAAVGWPAGNEMSPSRVTLPAYQGNTYVGRGYTSAGIIGRVVMDGWHMWLPATEL